MALSKRQAQQVGEEKRRAALRGGHSEEKADQYAREVRLSAARERAAEAARKKS